MPARASCRRIPPRSAIVAFSAEQVYAVAEMLRRFRGGAAVVMGALSPETRNKQVALYQSAKSIIWSPPMRSAWGSTSISTMSPSPGCQQVRRQRQRRLTTPEMAQIAGRAGRHQRDGTFRHAGGHRRPRCRIHRRGSLRDRGASLSAADPAVLARGRAAIFRLAT
jgi:ATP-dependent RNA helicase SUPV3L1/SUV3